MRTNVALCCSGDGSGGCRGRGWSLPHIGSDSAPGTGTVFHMHLLIWPRGQTNTYEYLLSFNRWRTWGWRGMSLALSYPTNWLESRNPEPTYDYYVRLLLKKVYIQKEEFSFLGSVSRCQAGTRWLTPHLALVLPRWCWPPVVPPDPAGSQPSVWVNSVGFQSCRSKEYESSVRIGPFTPPGIENDFYFFPVSFWLWLLKESE